MAQTATRIGLQIRDSNTSLNMNKKTKKPVMKMKKGSNTQGLENMDPTGTTSESVRKEKTPTNIKDAPSTLFSIYEDPLPQTEKVNKRKTSSSKPVVKCEIGTQTVEDNSSRALHDLLCSDDAPDGYYKVLSEQRGEALRETLVENEELYMKIEKLKEENLKLKMIADQAEYFADMYQRLKAAYADETTEEVSSTFTAESS